MENYLNFSKKGNIILLLMLFTFFSCNEDFLDQETRDFIAPDNLYVDEQGFDAGLNSLYALARAERAGVPTSSTSIGTSNNLTASMMFGGTDIAYGNRPWGSERFLNDWGDDVIGSSSQTYFTRTWNWLYRMINGANTIINRAESQGTDLGIDEDSLRRIIGEARTLRAWCYRHLTFLFGDVPLNLEESLGENVRLDWDRTPVDQIREKMKEDLEYAAQYLPENHTSNGKIVRAVAQHYLTELLIIEQDYDRAITTALAAINGPKSLINFRYGVNASNNGTPYSDMFLDGNSNPSEGNNEALWVFQHAFEVEGGEGHNIMRRWLTSEYSSSSGGAKGLEVTVARGGRGNTRLSATKFMLDLYGERDAYGLLKTNDDRGGIYSWRTFFTVIANDPSSAGNIGDVITLDFSPIDPLGDRFRPFTMKWAFDTNNVIDSNEPASDRLSRSYNDQVYLRLADTYLLLSEAYHLSGDDQSAAQYINDLRSRANAPLISASDISIDFILDERARELFSEEQRRYTLLRTNKWIERTNLHNINASGKIIERDKLYPIPQEFIDSNLDNPIQNNPGY